MPLEDVDVSALRPIPVELLDHDSLLASRGVGRSVIFVYVVVVPEGA